MKKIIKIITLVFASLVLLFVVTVLAANLIVLSSARKNILEGDTEVTKKYDAIIVLGAGLDANGEPSLMLRDRLDEAIDLYWIGTSDRILLSGARMGVDYDETASMLRYALSKDVPREALELDYDGFSTYDSMLRAAENFKLETALVVTEEYHIYRALYYARKLGIAADGAVCRDREGGQMLRDIREVFARVKAVAVCGIL